MYEVPEAPDVHEVFERTATREQQFAYGILRAFLGVCFWSHALFVVFFGIGLQDMAHHMLFALAETHLPTGLILLFAYSIPFLDFLIGGMFVFGVATMSAILLAYAYLGLLLVNFLLDNDWLAVVISLAVGVALALLMVGRARFDRPWHRLLIPPGPNR